MWWHKLTFFDSKLTIFVSDRTFKIIFDSGDRIYHIFAIMSYHVHVCRINEFRFFSGSAAIVLHACSQCNACVQQVVCCMSQASVLHFCSQCEHVCSKCTACLQQVYCMSAASIQHIRSQCAGCLQPVYSISAASVLDVCSQC